MSSQYGVQDVLARHLNRARGSASYGGSIGKGGISSSGWNAYMPDDENDQIAGADPALVARYQAAGQKSNWDILKQFARSAIQGQPQDPRAAERDAAFIEKQGAWRQEQDRKPFGMDGSGSGYSELRGGGKRSSLVPRALGY